MRNTGGSVVKCWGVDEALRKSKMTKRMGVETSRRQSCKG